MFTEERLTAKAEKGTIYNMKREHTYHSTRRRGLRGSRLYPVLSLLLCLILLGGGLFVLFAYVPKWVQGAVDTPADLVAWGLQEATPSPSPVPVATPSPTPVLGEGQALFSADLKELQEEIVVGEYQYAADFSCYKGKLVFAAGNYSTDGGAAFVRVITVDLTTGKKEYLALPQRYHSIRYPLRNEKWLVYLDVQGQGGGLLRCRNLESGEDKILKTIHMGVPRLTLWEDTVYWIERTGSSRFKLFGCDLSTGESVTLEVLESSEAGVSAPWACEDILVYVNDSGELVKLDINTGVKKKTKTGTYVHDPKTNGREIAFLTGNHGYDSDLVYMDVLGELHTVAKGVADFAIGEDFLAYGDMDKCYVYFFTDGSTFCITRSEEQSQFLGAGEKYVWWMDVTWRDKDIIEYMALP